MESIEVSAKTVEEAVELALDKLGVSRSEVDVEVLCRGKSGLLGLGSELARVKVKLCQQPIEEVVAVDMAVMAKEVLERLLDSMKISTLVEFKEFPCEVGEASISLDIKGEDLGILVGRRGQTLAALQYIVNLIVSRRFMIHAGVAVDVEGYRERRSESLRLLALRLADRVKTTGRSFTLEPMPASERRIVHLALRGDPEIVTQSVGEGENRKIVITCKAQY